MTIDTLIAELRADLDKFGDMLSIGASSIRALLDHIERVTSERDAADDRLDAVRIDLLTEQSERKVAEAELARLRAPVMEGEVGDCLAKLNNRKVNEPDFGMRLRHEAADLLQRLAGQVAEAQQDRCVPTCHEIADKAFAARDAAETRLREAVEVMRPFAVHGEFVDFHFPDDGNDVVAAGLPDNPITLGHFRRARAFLSTLEDHSNG